MTKLFDKIYGCEACAAIGNSMGEPVEGWTWQKIEQEHGFVDTFLPGDRFEKDQVSPQRFGEDWVYRAYHREPGWTEDGMGADSALPEPSFHGVHRPLRYPGSC